MKNKEEKKGFWASLFAPKQSSCCSVVVEEVAQDNKNIETEDKPKEKAEPKCSCGGKC